MKGNTPLAEMTKQSLKNAFEKCLNANYIHIENDASFSVKRDGDDLLLLFEWSNGSTDWRNNLDFPARPYRDMESGNGWFCHRGFLRVWKSLEKYLANTILDKQVKSITIVGYSHGAAIALLCYEYVKYNRPDVEVLGLGFGCPRVFWGFACKKVMRRFDDFYVIRNGRDLVTHLPPALFGFCHVGTVWQIGQPWSYKDFKKTVQEVGLREAMDDHAHIGFIKDHYPSRYIKGLGGD